MLGKKVRFLRRQGIVPANVFGHAESSPVQLAAKETEQVISRAGRTQLVDLTMDGGQPTTVLIKDYQRHPVKGSLLHVDFYRVAMTERLQVDVPLRLVGDPPAVKQFDATVFQSLSTVTVESLPADLPEAIDVDISGLAEVDDSLHVRDLTPPAGVTIVGDPEEMVVKMLPPTVEEAPEVPEEEAEGAEAAAEPAEAETAGETSSE